MTRIGMELAPTFKLQEFQKKGRENNYSTAAIWYFFVKLTNFAKEKEKGYGAGDLANFGC